MKKLYPFKFAPYAKEVVWGGSSLVSGFGKTVPMGEDGKPSADSSHIGETWEVSDMPGRLSVVSNGFLAGNDISDLMETYMGEIVGDNVFDYYNNQFPLLIKLLDICGRLSVQVHPDDEKAGERYGSYGKTEFWYVVDAAPDAEVYMGFARDTSASELYDACKAGTAQKLMNVFHPKKGDFFFVEAGTVHAASSGVIIAEVQEASDITFRLYDWGRENNPATRREMHLEEALDCIDFKKYDEDKYHGHAEKGFCNIASCRHFGINSIDLAGPRNVDRDEIESFIVYICTEGAAEIKADGESYSLGRGETILVPAAVDEFTINPVVPSTHVLEVYMPHLSETDGYFDAE